MKVSAVVLAVLSPTWAIIECRKKQVNFDKRTGLESWSRGWFVFALVALGAAYLVTTCFSEKMPLVRGHLLTYLVLWVLPFSRCNEIVFAFYRDSMDKLQASSRPTNGQSEAASIWGSGLTPSDRIKLLLRSYVEVAINFSIIYFFLSPCMYRFTLDSQKNIESPIQALYFSVITITTLGYGDIVPASDPARILAGYEVIAGLLLIVLAFAIYVSSLSDKPTRDN